MLMFVFELKAQVPQAFNYQAVARNSSGNLLASQTISIKITIHQSSASGTVVYSETHGSVTTNQFGLFTINIGEGTPVSGTFSGVTWSSGDYWLQVQMDPLGGSSYTDMGTAKLLTVPFAMYAANAGTSGVTGPTGPAGATGVAGVTGATGPTGTSSQSLSQVLAVGNSAGTYDINMNGKSITNANVLGLNGSNANYIDMYYGHILDYWGSHGTDGQVLTVHGTSPNTYVAWETPSGAIHAIGDSYGGGKVFYIYDGGQHGLIAATADQSTGIRWYGGSYTNTRARGDGVGAGLKNTAIIIADQGPVDGSAFAATVCNEYSVTVGGVTYGDWYLPSKSELNLLYLQKTVVGGFANNYYWSSSEHDYNYAWIQDFSSGSQLDGAKVGIAYVRAIRAF